MHNTRTRNLLGPKSLISRHMISHFDNRNLWVLEEAFLQLINEKLRYFGHQLKHCVMIGATVQVEKTQTTVLHPL